MGGCEADLVIARVGSTECEAATRRSPLIHNSVVVVEGLVDSNRNTEIGVLGKGVDGGVVELGFVTPFKGCQRRQLLGKASMFKSDISSTYQLLECPLEAPRRST